MLIPYNICLSSGRKFVHSTQIAHSPPPPHYCQPFGFCIHAVCVQTCHRYAATPQFLNLHARFLVSCRKALNEFIYRG